MNIKEALQWASGCIAGDSARLDAEVLLAQCLQRDRTFLYTWPERQLSEAQLTQFKSWVAERQQGSPVAYIVGEKEFWSLKLWVSPATLIPRPETELLVELVLEHWQRLGQPQLKILDLGTGTGAIALALAHDMPSCEIVAVDVKPEAVELAQKNCLRHKLTNVTVFHSNWFAEVSGGFDVIVSNPPYIEQNDEHLAQGDVRFEPRSALVAQQNGLADLSLIIQNSPPCLLSGGLLLLEHGFNQLEAVMNLLRAAGFSHVFNQTDLAGLPRVSGGVFE